MNQDKILITVLPDGTLKTETSKVSLPNHSSAEGFLASMSRLCGGVISMLRKGHSHAHTHTHTHEGEHEHGGQTHTH